MCVRGLPSIPTCQWKIPRPYGGCDKNIIELNGGFFNKPRLMTPEDLYIIIGQSLVVLEQVL